MGHAHAAGGLLRYLFYADAAVAVILTIVLLVAFVQNQNNERTRSLRIWWIVSVALGVGLVLASMIMRHHHGHRSDLNGTGANSTTAPAQGQ